MSPQLFAPGTPSFYLRICQKHHNPWPVPQCLLARTLRFQGSQRQSPNLCHSHLLHHFHLEELLPDCLFPGYRTVWAVWVRGNVGHLLCITVRVPMSLKRHNPPLEPHVTFVQHLHFLLTAVRNAPLLLGPSATKIPWSGPVPMRYLLQIAAAVPVPVPAARLQICSVAPCKTPLGGIYSCL